MVNVIGLRPQPRCVHSEQVAMKRPILVGVVCIVVGFFAGAVLLAGRVEYLRRYAAFHEREADRFSNMIGTFRNASYFEVNWAMEVATENHEDCRLDWQFLMVLYHRDAAEAYRHAIFRPWTVVKEPTPPERQYDE
jgi:hypothetical protein